MRHLLRYFFLVLGLPLLHCFYNEEKDCYEAPFWCDSHVPGSGEVAVLISPQYINDSTKIVFYDGKVESGTPMGSYRQISDSALYDLSYGYISASIRYNLIIDGKPSVLTAIDGGDLKYKEDEYCDGVFCYKSGKLKLDLRVKE